MKCILCRWARWSIGRRDPVWVEEADKIEAETPRAGMNTDALFSADPQADRLRELSTLWKTDPTDALRQFFSLAEAGSVWSMIQVGWAYEAGVGTAADRTLAERWFTFAHEQGSDHGLLESARLALARGDVAKARAALSAGVGRGVPQAMVALAWVELKSAKLVDARMRARALFEEAIGHGYLPAKTIFARAMARGVFGWREIPDGIGRLFVAAAEIGDLIEAQKKRRLASEPKP